MPDVLKNAVELLYPLHCGGCGTRGFVLCRECIENFRIVEETSTCPVCGRWIGRRIVCGECMEKKRGFQKGCYGFYFENRLRDALHAFKFQKRKDVGRHLVSLVTEKIAPLREEIDAIIPIPVTEKRLKERGFNQSFIIAEEISKIVARPVLHSILLKTKETNDQYSLSRDERQKNIRGVFEARDGKPIKGKRLLLVDDLFTTGFTIREAARVLSREKAKDVIVFALARTGS